MKLVTPISTSIITSKIEDEILKMGPLQSTATVIVDYVRSMSSDAEFKCYSAWTLEPDNWITLRFAYKRRYSITTTLGVPVESLPNTTGLRIDQRYSWSRIQIRSISDLPVALECIRHAFYFTSNRFRKQHGMPNSPFNKR